MGGKGSGRKPGYTPSENQIEAARRNAKKMQELRKIPEGKNAETGAFLIKVFTLPPIDYTDAEQVQNRLVEYVTICYENDQKPTQEGAAMALGFSRTTWQNVISGKTKRSPQVVAIMQNFQNYLNAYISQIMLDNRTNPVSAIFTLKNNFENYKDVQEHRFTYDIENLKTREQLEEKYSRAIEVEFTDVEDK